jgi:hypothetical protein
MQEMKGRPMTIVSTETCAHLWGNGGLLWADGNRTAVIQLEDLWRTKDDTVEEIKERLDETPDDLEPTSKVLS